MAAVTTIAPDAVYLPVREFLGHADPRTTLSYVTRFRWNVRRNVVDVLPDPEERP